MTGSDLPIRVRNDLRAAEKKVRGAGWGPRPARGITMMRSVGSVGPKTGTGRHYSQIGGQKRAVRSLTIPAGPRVQVPLIGSETH